MFNKQKRSYKSRKKRLVTIKGKISNRSLLLITKFNTCEFSKQFDGKQFIMTPGDISCKVKLLRGLKR